MFGINTGITEKASKQKMLYFYHLT